jgi:hypothetical protein
MRLCDTLRLPNDPPPGENVGALDK